MRRVGGVDAVLDPMAWSYMDRTLSSKGVLNAGAKYLLLTTHYSLLTTYYLLLTIRC